MPIFDALNARRHWFSAVATLAIGIAIVLAGRPNFNKPSALPVQRAMALVLETIVSEALPQVRPSAKLPEPKVQSIRPLEKAQAPLPNPPQPLATTVDVTPHAGNASSRDSLAASPAEPTRNATPTLAAATPSPIAELPARQPTPVFVPLVANLEGPFIGQIRAMLNASKRYPTGREVSLQRPMGKVVVWFVLTRSGALKDTGVEESSNSMVLDNAALSTIRRATFPKFPDAAWPGSDTHRFTVTVDFIPPA
jgi:protein TonB